jgi:hypothetical protein
LKKMKGRRFKEKNAKGNYLSSWFKERFADLK